MIPDINLVREKRREVKEKERLEQMRRREEFEKVKEKIVPYEFNYLQLIINNKLNRGVVPAESIRYKECMQHMHDEYQFTCEDYECFEVMDAIGERIKDEYGKAGYDVDISRHRANGSHFSDFDQITIHF